jgi:hypothetical protein
MSPTGDTKDVAAWFSKGAKSMVISLSERANALELRYWRIKQ